MNKRWTCLLGLLLASALLAGACGGDETPDEADAAGDADTDAGSSGGSGDLTEGAGDGSGMAGVLANADCRQYVDAFADLDPGSGSGDVTTFADLADFLDQVADEVPNEISDDFRVVANGYRSFADAMGGFDFTDPTGMTPEDLQALEAASQQLDTDQFQEAVSNIETFLNENCVVE